MLKTTLHSLVRLLGQALFVVVACSGQASAATYCTHIPDSVEYPVPMDERENLRVIQTRVFSERLAEGGQQLAAGRNLDAVNAYFKVFQRFSYHGIPHGMKRCAAAELYQRAADGLKTAAEPELARLVRQGQFEDTHKNGRFEPGALRLLLMSNQYDEFVRQALNYAAAELIERDVDLQPLVEWRMQTLEDAQGVQNAEVLRLDLTPLLSEELAAFETLSNFEARLAERLDAQYPKVTAHWLATEQRHYKRAIETRSVYPRQHQFYLATEALERGFGRVQQQDIELQRLRDRANSRGVALLEIQQYDVAQDYFEMAGNTPMAAKAGELQKTQEEENVRKSVAEVETDLQKVLKTDTEQAEFQEDAEEMAAEFGFDLDE